jgi:hypothetical protein
MNGFSRAEPHAFTRDRALKARLYTSLGRSERRTWFAGAQAQGSTPTDPARGHWPSAETSPFNPRATTPVPTDMADGRQHPGLPRLASPGLGMEALYELHHQPREWQARIAQSLPGTAACNERLIREVHC